LTSEGNVGNVFILAAATGFAGEDMGGSFETGGVVAYERKDRVVVTVLRRHDRQGTMNRTVRLATTARGRRTCR
jgi:hypothetical protein